MRNKFIDAEKSGFYYMAVLRLWNRYLRNFFPLGCPKRYLSTWPPPSFLDLWTRTYSFGNDVILAEGAKMILSADAIWGIPGIKDGFTVHKASASNDRFKMRVSVRVMVRGREWEWEWEYETDGFGEGRGKTHLPLSFLYNISASHSHLMADSPSPQDRLGSARFYRF